MLPVGLTMGLFCTISLIIAMLHHDNAIEVQRWRDVCRLQRLLAHSYNARLLAVRQVSKRKGKRTPGIENELWFTSFVGCVLFRMRSHNIAYTL
ncbi:MAG: reverse transcriptase N-terminal domain-containing protein [Myxococcota bacterium]